MSFDERLLYWLIGCAIGFVLGYIVRSLQEIRAKLDKVEEDVVKHNEDGLMRYPLLYDAAMLLVVAIALVAAFQTQRVNNDLKNTQEDLGVITLCNQQYLKAQADFLSVYLVENPPPPQAERQDALLRYFDLLKRFANKDHRKIIADSSNILEREISLEDCLEVSED